MEWRSGVGILLPVLVEVMFGVVVVGMAYHGCSIDGPKRVAMRKAMFQRTVCMLVLSKLVRFCRSRISSMRGCCHRPGVEAAGDGCCVGVLVPGVLALACESDVGAGVTFERTVVEIAEDFSCCKGDGMRLVEEVVRVSVLDGERTSAVDDILYCGFWVAAVAVLCCGR